jgi:hypothetical protein
MVLTSGQVQVFGAIDELLGTHKLLVGPAQPRQRPKIAGVSQIVTASHDARQTRLLVRATGSILDPAWDQYDVSLEDLVLAYLANGDVGRLQDLQGAHA